MEGLELRELSPLLTLLDNLLGHTTPLASPPDDLPQPTQPALWDLAFATRLHLQFLSVASPSLHSCLAKLGLVLCSGGGGDDSGSSVGGATLLALRPSDDSGNQHLLTRADVLTIVRKVENSLEQPTCVKQQLAHVVESVMQCCTEIIAAECESYVSDIAMLRACKVQPATLFNEPWSVGMETAWMASAAEGVLIYPNYEHWTPAHVEHRAKSWRSVQTESTEAPPVSMGRLWRFEHWECLRTPCHEVIHLVQHVAGQTMSMQLAEHDGAFSTYVLMLAVAEKVTAPATKSGSAEGDALAAYFFPGAVQEALLESLDYCRRFHRQEMAEATERWAPNAVLDYMTWRDSWGVAQVQSWAEKSTNGFGGDMQVENICKNFLALEAVCRDGQFLATSEDVQQTTVAMLQTMFKDRTGNVNSCEVDIKEPVQLSTSSVGARIDSVLECVGTAAASEALATLCV